MFNKKNNIIKTIILVLLSISVLSACQNILVNDNNDLSDAQNLSTQYSDGQVSGQTAADVNTQLGAGYINNGRYDRALVKLNKALGQDPNHALAHNYLGVLYARLERPDGADKEFKKSVQLAPNDSTILNNYAIFLCEQKQFGKAEQIFNKVVNNPLYIKRAEAYQNAGWCALKNNEIARSEELYRKAVALSPDLSNSLLGLAKINYKKSSYEYAWSYFERYDKITRPNADALWLGINILYKRYVTDNNLLSSYELQLKNKFPDSNEAKWLYQGRQEY
ncbi:MAG: type IV pilus biogenesis/stability protein PilW [Gammaproteobacteria bacterium]|nr:type IV pilus biogenesis/stability protein PilW [Gammaproteobacteria bacterium]